MSGKKLQDNVKIKIHIIYFFKGTFSYVYINCWGEEFNTKPILVITSGKWRRARKGKGLGMVKADFTCNSSRKKNVFIT